MHVRDWDVNVEVDYSGELVVVVDAYLDDQEFTEALDLDKMRAAPSKTTQFLLRGQLLERVPPLMAESPFFVFLNLKPYRQLQPA